MRPNFFTLLELDPTLEDQAAIAAAVDRFENRWMTRRALARGPAVDETEAQLALVPEMRRVMLDPGLQSAERTALRPAGVAPKEASSPPESPSAPAPPRSTRLSKEPFAALMAPLEPRSVGLEKSSPPRPPVPSAAPAPAPVRPPLPAPEAAAAPARVRLPRPAPEADPAPAAAAPPPALRVRPPVPEAGLPAASTAAATVAAPVLAPPNGSGTNKFLVGLLVVGLVVGASYAAYLAGTQRAGTTDSPGDPTPGPKRAEVTPAVVTTPTSAAPRPPSPVTAPPADPPGLAACARSAEAKGRDWEWRAGAEALQRCVDQAVLPATAMELRLRKAKVLWDGYLESEAKSEYDAVLRDYPNEPGPHNRLAWYLLTTSRPRASDILTLDRERALGLAERGVTLSGRQDHRILDTLAEAYLQNGRKPQALATLDEVARLTRKKVYAPRYGTFVRGKTRFMVMQEFTRSYQEGQAWTPALDTLSEEATRRPLERREVEPLPDVQRYALRNAIFARRGQRLGHWWLDDLFASRPWYTPRKDFVFERDITALDKENVKLIKEIESGNAEEDAPSGE